MSATRPMPVVRFARTRASGAVRAPAIDRQASTTPPTIASAESQTISGIGAIS